MKGAKHAEMVAMLKTDHEMGHGHANAIVAPLSGREQSLAIWIKNLLERYGVVGRNTR